MKNERFRSYIGEILLHQLLSKRAWLIISLLGLFFMSMHGSVLVKANEKEVIFEKVQEETYEDFIRAMAFGSVVKEGKEQIYPKVIVFKDEVQFLDESGKMISRKSLLVNKPKEVGKYFGKEAILSRKGNFVAIHEYTGEFGEVEYIVEEEYTICNDRGEEIYKIQGPPEETGEGDRLVISDKDGSVVRAKIEYGALDFYSPNGVAKTVPISGEPAWGRRVANVRFSGDGEYLAVLVREITRIWFMLFDRSGNELWRRKIDEQGSDIYKPQNMAISEKGEYLVFKAFTMERTLPKRGDLPPKKGERVNPTSVTLSLCDKQGNELSFKDTSLFTFDSFCFSPQAQYLALGGRKLVRVMRTKDGATVFEKELSHDIGIKTMMFSGDGEYLIVQRRVPTGVVKITESPIPGMGDRTWYSNRVFVINMEGEIVWQNDFQKLRRDMFSENGFVAFSFSHKYKIYKIIEKD